MIKMSFFNEFSITAAEGKKVDATAEASNQTIIKCKKIETFQFTK